MIVGKKTAANWETDGGLRCKQSLKISVFSPGPLYFCGSGIPKKRHLYYFPQPLNPESRSWRHPVAQLWNHEFSDDFGR